MKVTSQHVGGTLPGSAPGSEASSASGKINKANLDTKNGGVGKSSGMKSNPNSSEKVDLSQRVLDMQKIKELASSPDTINEAKVAQLQKLIDQGEYNTDADAIADRMVDEHLNMPS